ncbi:hypothetical protein [Ruegeria aquimaris]|uniref:Uncharacterized protein n=1 Tax=Ruegeria aquimaris TaxID=2984333 RepID=A0ABT3AS50_9RHOB|nr:hypothetical protein [Ruegeria sp. XHP0148]MCV2891422.1 hypothetical protein [Ruegeria sp. XHP0148]
MTAINPDIYARVADFLRGAVQGIFDSRFDWTPDAESILVTMQDGGMTEAQEQRFRPYFDLFVDQCRAGSSAGFPRHLTTRALRNTPRALIWTGCLQIHCARENRETCSDGPKLTTRTRTAR